MARALGLCLAHAVAQPVRAKGSAEEPAVIRVEDPEVEEVGAGGQLVGWLVGWGSKSFCRLNGEESACMLARRGVGGGAGGDLRRGGGRRLGGWSVGPLGLLQANGKKAHSHGMRARHEGVRGGEEAGPAPLHGGTHTHMHACVKEALHEKAQRGGPKALRERTSNIMKCRVVIA